MRLKSLSRVAALSVVMSVVMLSAPTVSFARDAAQEHSIQAAMDTSTAQSFNGVRFFFGKGNHPAVKRTIGTYSSRRSTNAFGKSDMESCQWAFLSAVKTFYERALAEGGNAVINIQSVTTGPEFSSTDKYQCRAGNVVSKVYLTGDVVVM